MSRILAIDYGRKRCGVAVTDNLQIVANSLPVIRTCDLMEFLDNYFKIEIVEKVIIGLPRQMNGDESDSMRYIKPFVNQFKRRFPDMNIEFVDERFTSVIAHRDMITAGFKKSDRQRKGLADEMSATIILNTWLETHK